MLAWLPLARPWATRGLVAWALTVHAGRPLPGVGAELSWMLTANVLALDWVASGLLWALELFVLVTGVGYVRELVDVMLGEAGAVGPRPTGVRNGNAVQPFVSVHVQTHNEPPEMVISTLEHLLELDYDAVEIVLVDNNTDDPALWRPVQDFCGRHDRSTFCTWKLLCRSSGYAATSHARPPGAR